MKAKVIPDAITVIPHTIEGQYVLETLCRDFDEYCALPQVVEYEGKQCGKCGWNSDTGRACYKEGISIAHRVN